MTRAVGRERTRDSDGAICADGATGRFHSADAGDVQNDVLDTEGRGILLVERPAVRRRVLSAEGQ